MKIVAIEPLGLGAAAVEEACRRYLGDCHELIVIEKTGLSDEELLSQCGDADILLEVNRPLTADFIGQCKNLKLIAVAFAGIDHIDEAACVAAGVKIANCPGYSAAAVAELVFGFLTALKRRIPEFDGEVRQGGTRRGFVGTEINGKTFGIVGFGHVGQRVAKIAAAYGCEVLAFSRSSHCCDGVEFVGLDELLKRSDIVSLHVPLTGETVHLLSAAKIDVMKPGAILINTARGPVVDYKALAAALKEGRLGGAGIDVFENEPPIAADHCLFGIENAVLAPHIGFATTEAFVNRLEMSFANIRNFIANS